MIAQKQSKFMKPTYLFKQNNIYIYDNCYYYN